MWVKESFFALLMNIKKAHVWVLLRDGLKIIPNFCHVQFSVILVQMKLVQWNTWHYIVLFVPLCFARSVLLWSFCIFGVVLFCFVYLYYCKFCIVAILLLYWSFSSVSLVLYCCNCSTLICVFRFVFWHPNTEFNSKS